MLTDKTIIVTGASSGIGKAIAIHLSSVGAKVVLIGRNIDRLAETQSQCAGETMTVSEDLSDFDSYDRIVSDIHNKFGNIYGFVHSAGIEQTMLIQQLKIKDLREIFDVNVFAAIQFIGTITKKKYRTETQSIVLISSIMGVVGNKGLTSYSATKGALISMIRSMALEMAAKGVRINAISPGHIADSGMTKTMEHNLSEEANEKIKNNHPLGLGTCNDVAYAVKFLLSEESRWMTGQNLILDGGYSIQ
ncbi:MAG TPA: SDR family oxidoreductase [Flavobacterium sp.]|jgi:NAD(P)-dependent dehydrogenase (short-subunit alcohol dehydrogenase family)|nr:SDR family oxidoreductase [Flavobacterium sp.]